jgi:sortase A
MKKIVSLLLILLGISIFLYPTVKDLYTVYNQKQIINNWENNLDAAESLGKLEDVFSVETKAETVESKSVSVNEKQKNAKKVEMNKTQKSIVGIIEIDKINLRLPVLNGASMDNLDIGSGLLEGTALPGMLGNSAIAAHRSRSYGKMFNRLDEIATGDVVTVRDKNQTYQYEVYETLVVEPNDLSVLNSSSDEKTLTLITCTPIDTGTHRLIIKAKMP